VVESALEAEVEMDAVGEDVDNEDVEEAEDIDDVVPTLLPELPVP